MLADSDLQTVGPATENAHRSNSVRTHGMDSSGAPAERIVWPASRRSACHGGVVFGERKGKHVVQFLEKNP